MYKDNAETPRSKRACWNRIEAVINMAHMTTNAFARHIGLPRGENLYQIKRGNNGVSLDLANRIVAKFSEVSKLWLLLSNKDNLGAKVIKIMEIIVVFLIFLLFYWNIFCNFEAII